MARQMVFLGLILALFVAFASAAEEVNPAPKVSPDSPTASPLPAEKGDDSTIGAGDDDVAAAPGMAVAAPGDAKAPSAATAGATRGLVSVLAAAGFFSFFFFF